MIEKFKQFEDNITEQEVVEALKSKGIENQEAKDLLIRYTDQCHSESNTEAMTNPDFSNRANIKAEIKIAELYLKTQYKDYAIESLNEIYQNAGQSELTKDLAVQINSLINRFSL